MLALLTVLAVACCAAVAWSALHDRVPAATGWTLGAATVATTVVALLSRDVPSRFAASVLAVGCMAESVWTMTMAALQRRRTTRAVARS